MPEEKDKKSNRRGRLNARRLAKMTYAECKNGLVKNKDRVIQSGNKFIQSGNEVVKNKVVEIRNNVAALPRKMKEATNNVAALPEKIKKAVEGKSINLETPTSERLSNADAREFDFIFEDGSEAEILFKGLKKEQEKEQEKKSQEQINKEINSDYPENEPDNESEATHSELDFRELNLIEYDFSNDNRKTEWPKLPVKTKKKGKLQEEINSVCPDKKSKATDVDVDDTTTQNQDPDKEAYDRFIEYKSIIPKGAFKSVDINKSRTNTKVDTSEIHNQTSSERSNQSGYHYQNDSERTSMSENANPTISMFSAFINSTKHRISNSFRHKERTKRLSM